MKLYTEEQVLIMLNICRDSDLYEHILTFEDILKTEKPIKLPSDSLCINCDESKSTHNVCIDCMIKIGKENIEIPSDEEIWRWWQTQKFQKEQGEQEYTMLYEIDLPKILKSFTEHLIQGDNK